MDSITVKTPTLADMDGLLLLVMLLLPAPLLRGLLPALLLFPFPVPAAALATISQSEVAFAMSILPNPPAAIKCDDVDDGPALLLN